MDTRLKIRELLESMDATERHAMGEELAAMGVAAREVIALEHITADRLTDAAFAARVRADIHAALRGEI